MYKRTLPAALILLSACGLFFHFRIHYFMVPDPQNPSALVFNRTLFLAVLFPLIDLVFVTLLFLSRRTAVYGYLLNGLLVILGTILMSHLSISVMIERSIPLPSMILSSTLPDIGITWADFLVGKTLYDLYMRGS